jgi:hypothetical protein
MERREINFWTFFFDACYLKRRREARAIIDSSDFVSPEWQKDLLRAHHPIIESRSRTLNGFVRQQTPQSILSLKEERYLRIKGKAIDMLSTLLDDPEMPDLEKSMFKAVLTPPTSIPALKQAFA